MNIEILRTAYQDLINGYHFYEKQRPNLGAYFIDSLFTDIDSLQTTAGIHLTVFNQFYRLLSKRFPFAIYYKIEKETVYVYAVLDCRRNPAWIRDKLK